MKKYIGLICGAVLLVALVAGCSDAHESGGGVSGIVNPFAGTSWTCLSMRVSFEENTAVYYTGGETVTLEYSSVPEGDGYMAMMSKGTQPWGSFKIASADANTGSFAGYTTWRRN